MEGFPWGPKGGSWARARGSGREERCTPAAGSRALEALLYDRVLRLRLLSVLCIGLRALLRRHLTIRLRGWILTFRRLRRHRIQLVVRPIIITAKGQAKDAANGDLTPVGVDREFVLLNNVFDENDSPYMEPNIFRYITRPQMHGAQYSSQRMGEGWVPFGAIDKARVLQMSDGGMWEWRMPLRTLVR